MDSELIELKNLDQKAHTEFHLPTLRINTFKHKPHYYKINFNQDHLCKINFANANPNIHIILSLSLWIMRIWIILYVSSLLFFIYIATMFPPKSTMTSAISFMGEFRLASMSHHHPINITTSTTALIGTPM